MGAATREQRERDFSCLLYIEFRVLALPSHPVNSPMTKRTSQKKPLHSYLIPNNGRQRRRRRLLKKKAELMIISLAIYIVLDATTVELLQTVATEVNLK